MDSPARSAKLICEPTSQANDLLMMPDRNQRRTIQVNRQYFEEHVHHRCSRLVKNGVVYIPRFKEEIARGVNYSLIRQDVSHVAGGDLADAGALVIVLTHMSAGRKRQLGDSELVLSIDLLEEAFKRRLELDFGDQAAGVDFDWAYAYLRARLARLSKQCHERCRCESQKKIASDGFIVWHDKCPVAASRRQWQSKLQRKPLAGP
jgi:hypothetical protein